MGAIEYVVQIIHTKHWAETPHPPFSPVMQFFLFLVWFGRFAMVD